MATPAAGAEPADEMKQTTAPPVMPLGLRRRKELSTALDALCDVTGLLPPLNSIVAEYGVRSRTRVSICTLPVPCTPRHCSVWCGGFAQRFMLPLY
jgi:hypothetical protein